MRDIMPIQFKCSCGRTLQAQDEHAGRRVKCPSCNEEMTVPAGATAVKSAEASPAKASPVQADEPRRRPDRDDDDRPRRARARDDDDEDDDDRPRRRKRERDDDEDEDEDDRPRRRSRRREDDEDDDDRRRQPAATSGKATAALVLGLLSFCVNIFAGIPAIVLALMSFGDIKRSRGRLGGKGLAVAGLVLGCLGILSGLALIPAVVKVREAAARVQSTNNLRQMALAMLNHSDAKGHLPEAIPEAKLPGQTKLSWRVQLLPYLGHDNIYRQFRHNEPWDSPHNKALLTNMPQVFAHPSHPEENAQGLTHYRVFVGEQTPFAPGKPARIPATFQDGTSNTILIVEAADPVPWTKPEGLEYDPAKPLPKLGHDGSGVLPVALADGSVRLLNRVSDQTLRAAITPAGGEVMGGDW
jgi:Protein of unknown function (DUF1559)/Domain of unknown function (DUF4190)